MEKTIEKYPVKNGVRKRVKDNIHKTFDKVLDYIEKMSKEKVEDCDFQKLEKVPVKLRFKSIQLNLLEAVDNLTYKSH